MPSKPVPRREEPREKERNYSEGRRVERVYAGEDRRPPRKVDAEFDRGSSLRNVRPTQDGSEEANAAGRQLFNHLTGNYKSSENAKVNDDSGDDELIVTLERPSISRTTTDRGDAAAAGSTANKKLFDPRTHDAARFGAKSNSRTTSPIPAPSVLPTDRSSFGSQAVVNEIGSPRDARQKAGDGQTELSDAKHGSDNQSIVADMKKAYRKIVELEGKRLAAAEQEQETREMARDHRGANSVTIMSSQASNDNSAATTATAGLLPTQAIKSREQPHNDEYWLGQIQRHKESVLSRSADVYNQRRFCSLAESHHNILNK